MKLQIKKLSTKAVFPTKAHPTDAGFDFYATNVRAIYEENSPILKYYEYNTDIAINIPIGYVGLLFPRSSIRHKDIILSNCVGVIDPGYTGEIKFSYKDFFSRVVSDKYEIGDRIGQLIVVKTEDILWEEVDSFEESERGDNGHGSSGR